MSFLDKFKVGLDASTGANSPEQARPRPRAELDPITSWDGYDYMSSVADELTTDSESRPPIEEVARLAYTRKPFELVRELRSSNTWDSIGLLLNMKPKEVEAIYNKHLRRHKFQCQIEAIIETEYFGRAGNLVLGCEPLKHFKYPGHDGYMVEKDLTRKLLMMFCRAIIARKTMVSLVYRKSRRGDDSSRLSLEMPIAEFVAGSTEPDEGVSQQEHLQNCHDDLKNVIADVHKIGQSVMPTRTRDSGITELVIAMFASQDEIED